MEQVCDNQHRWITEHEGDGDVLPQASSTCEVGVAMRIQNASAFNATLIIESHCIEPDEVVIYPSHCEYKEARITWTGTLQPLDRAWQSMTLGNKTPKLILMGTNAFETYRKKYMQPRDVEWNLAYYHGLVPTVLPEAPDPMPDATEPPVNNDSHRSSQ